MRQAVGEVQSLELHQYKVAMVVSRIMIKNKVFLKYIMGFNEILRHNLYLFVLTLSYRVEFGHIITFFTHFYPSFTTKFLWCSFE